MLKEIADIAISAGKEILKVYHSDEMEVETKTDESPLTAADKRAHQTITAGLTASYPLIPILSEEGELPQQEERQQWKRFWLVDPLDGTKEFIKKNGEFTVNIALIEGDRPVLSCIYAPVLDELYAAEAGKGSWKLTGAAEKNWPDEAALLKAGEKLPSVRTEKVTAVVSRSHLTKETEQVLDVLRKEYGDVQAVSAGSSLKLCLTAEGKADLYPRMAPTMEWDIAAGQLIIEEAGGEVINAETRDVMRYNKNSLVNPSFHAKSSRLKQQEEQQGLFQRVY